MFSQGTEELHLVDSVIQDLQLYNKISAHALAG